MMLEKHIISEANYRYIELGQGTPVVILHGLMGGLSNFEGVMNYFPSKGYKILVPELPVYDLPLINSSGFQPTTLPIFISGDIFKLIMIDGYILVISKS